LFMHFRSDLHDFIISEISKIRFHAKKWHGIQNRDWE
jgi:hypothetical protein